MKKYLGLTALFLFLASIMHATITSVSKPYTIDTATVPKVRYIDSNDSTFQVKINEVVDSANIYFGGGLKAQTIKSTSNIKFIIDSDSNETGRAYIFTNHLNDTLAKIGDDSTVSVRKLTVAGVTTQTGNLNVAGTTNTTGYVVNAAGHIVATGTSNVYSFGVGAPTNVAAGNFEAMSFGHNGTNGLLRMHRGGTGGYRPMLIQNGGSTAITVDTTQNVTFASTTAHTGKATFTDSIVGASQRLTGNLRVAKVTATDTVVGANLKTAGSLTVTGDGTINKLTAADTVVGGKLKTSGSLTVTGNGTIAKLTASDSVLGTVAKFSGNGIFSKVTASDTVVGTNLKTAGSLTVTGNETVAKVTASDTVVGANLKTAGSLTVTGNETVAKVTASDSLIGTVGKFSSNIAAMGTSTFSDNSSAVASLNTSVGSASGASVFRLRKSRGSIGSEADVQNADVVGYITGQAYSGGTYFTGAEVDYVVDGTFTSGQRPPSRLEFYTNVANTGNVKQLSIAGSGAAVFTSTLAATTIALGGNEAFDYDEGTFTATLTGISGSSTGTASYTRAGKKVTLYIPALTGTSNTTACTITGMPAAIRPATAFSVSVPKIMENTADHIGWVDVNTAGTITLGFFSAITTATQTFTSSGTKGLPLASAIAYTIQ
jgi:hypothetical protein